MSKTKLHPGAKWLFRFKIIWAIIFIIIFLGVFSFSIIIRATNLGIFSGFLSTIVVVFIMAIFLGELWVRLYYNRWFYEFTDTNLKLERGVIWKKYSNIPYARVQNVDIHRGIIARICGFSTVMIQTAGYSGGYGRYGRIGAEGSLPAVGIKTAEKIRDFLMKKISRRSSSGL